MVHGELRPCFPSPPALPQLTPPLWPSAPRPCACPNQRQPPLGDGQGATASPTPPSPPHPRNITHQPSSCHDASCHSQAPLHPLHLQLQLHSRRLRPAARTTVRAPETQGKQGGSESGPRMAAMAAAGEGRVTDGRSTLGTTDGRGRRAVTVLLDIAGRSFRRLPQWLSGCSHVLTCSGWGGG